MTILVQIGFWLLRKCGVALLLVLAVLVVGAGYLYLRENLRTEAERGTVAERLRAQVSRLEDKAIELEARAGEVKADIDKQRARVDTARRLLESFKSMNSLLDWVFGANVDPKELEEKRKNAQTTTNEAVAVMQGLEDRMAGLLGGRNEAMAEIERTREEIAKLDLTKSPVVQYLRDAWVRFRWPLVGALLAFFFGPTLWCLAAFYGLAPLVARSRPIRFRKDEAPEIEVTPSRVSEAVRLLPGESLFVRERFLQASDESLKRRTRFVLDWSIPFTCAAAGLIELVELTNNEPEGEAAATVSTQDDAAVELSVITVPEASGLVMRPSFLAGLILAPGGRLEVKRHWRLFHLQSWVTLQFRFFEFRGPCRLVAAGSRGIRAESLPGARAGPAAAARGWGRRTNQDATIGFTPGLSYRSVRAETFWSYFRNRNPLFDDVFYGRGTFLCQEIPTGAPGASVRRFWEAFWGSLLKIFGL